MSLIRRLFGCRHRFGPVHDTGIGYGRRCSKCGRFAWTETAGEASARMEAAEREEVERRVRKVLDRVREC